MTGELGLFEGYLNQMSVGGDALRTLACLIITPKLESKCFSNDGKSSLMTAMESPLDQE